ncbi:hypothetical protein FB472_1203 [Rhodoglobus vestalii]|uniref:TrbL/VirB6 plasmid conjugal transfer protein n=1 Tax=Rhodoglobus vestalii TaxID=193384 RepID=A0A8H2K654_9MICO|nr:hypothetical protein [Rhodoglobus vestalii]TQO19634.1 hypothetical protein FB472_1203 [Rhodoglobus vestalii]
MRIPKWTMLSISGAVAVGISVLVAAPAAAGPADVPYSAAVSAAQGEVTGQEWSAPAADVECIRTGIRITCAPTELASSVEERCFNKVIIGEQQNTVCSTSEDNIEAIRNHGGEELKIDFKCALLDPSCTVGQMAASAFATSIGGSLSWAISQTSFNSDSRLWEASLTEWAWWQGAIILVILGAGIVAIVMAMATGDRSDLVTAVSRFALSLPLSAASLWIIGNLLDIVDLMVEPIINRTNAGGGVEKFMENLIFGGGGGNIFAATSILGLLAIATGVLVAVFSFRNFALAALISMGPVAWMLFPTSFGKQWVVRYFSAVIALILTTPLTLGLLALVITGVGEVDTLWSIQALPFGIGLCMIAFVPIAAFSMFSFIGGTAADAVGSRMGSSATQQASRGVSMARGAASRANSARRKASQPRTSAPRTTSPSASSPSAATQKPQSRQSAGGHPSTPTTTNPSAVGAPAPQSARSSGTPRNGAS